MLFEKAFVVSLDIRRDRYESFVQRFGKFGEGWLPEIEKFSAIHGDTCLPPASWNAGNGAWGCYRSHMGIVERCMNEGVGSVIIFEDDAQFKEDFREKAIAFVEALPDDWEQAYLGGQLMHESSHPPYEVSPGVYRPFNVNRTHCYALSKTGMLGFYRHCSELPFENEFHIDHHLGRWHEDARTKVYCPDEWLVGQHGAQSNVSGKFEDVQFYRNPKDLALSHWLYKHPTCVVYRGSRSIVSELKEIFHFGNQTGNNGLDVTLHEATKLRSPSRAIAAWYGWVRKEAVDEGLGRIPALMHPGITLEEAAEALPGCKLIVVDSVSSVAEAKAFLGSNGVAL